MITAKDLYPGQVWHRAQVERSYFVHGWFSGLLKVMNEEGDHWITGARDPEFIAAQFNIAHMECVFDPRKLPKDGAVRIECGVFLGHGGESLFVIGSERRTAADSAHDYPLCRHAGTAVIWAPPEWKNPVPVVPDVTAQSWRS